ncbi:MAG: hypothetical protein Q9227_009493 [Pyrenula ochraceoflavens]
MTTASSRERFLCNVPGLKDTARQKSGIMYSQKMLQHRSTLRSQSRQNTKLRSDDPNLHLLRLWTHENLSQNFQASTVKALSALSQSYLPRESQPSPEAVSRKDFAIKTLNLSTSLTDFARNTILSQSLFSQYEEILRGFGKLHALMQTHKREEDSKFLYGTLIRLRKWAWGIALDTAGQDVISKFQSMRYSFQRLLNDLQQLCCLFHYTFNICADESDIRDLKAEIKHTMSHLQVLDVPVRSLIETNTGHTDGKAIVNRLNYGLFRWHIRNRLGDVNWTTTEKPHTLDQDSGMLGSLVINPGDLTNQVYFPAVREITSIRRRRSNKTNVTASARDLCDWFELKLKLQEKKMRLPDGENLFVHVRTIVEDPYMHNFLHKLLTYYDSELQNLGVKDCDNPKQLYLVCGIVTTRSTPPMPEKADQSKKKGWAATAAKFLPFRGVQEEAAEQWLIGMQVLKIARFPSWLGRAELSSASRSRIALTRSRGDDFAALL